MMSLESCRNINRWRLYGVSLDFEMTLLDDIEGDNGKYRNALKLQLSQVSAEIRRMDFYINLLSEEYSAVLKAIYIDGMSHMRAAAVLFIDRRTLVRRKEHGLKSLAEMYSRLPAQ